MWSDVKRIANVINLHPQEKKKPIECGTNNFELLCLNNITYKGTVEVTQNLIIKYCSSYFRKN